MTDLLQSFKETLIFFDEIADYVSFFTESLGLFPSIFLILLGLMIVIGFIFSVFHLIIVVVTH